MFREGDSVTSRSHSGGNSLILMYENSQADTYNNQIINEDV